MKYTKYPMFYHWIYQNGLEAELIPIEIRKQIPRSTYAYWRIKPCKLSDDYDDFHTVFEGQIRRLQKEIRMLQVQSNRQLVELIKITRGFVDIIGLDLVRDAIGKNKDDFIQCLEANTRHVTKRRVLKAIGISKSQFYDWSFINSKKCQSSSLGICNIKYNNQLSQRERNIIKKSLENPLFNGWSLKKICLYLCKHVDDFYVGKTTYYKYVNMILGKEGVALRKAKKQQPKGIRASAPNQLWQIDITHLQTSIEGKAYLYCVIDNYSRKVLAWELSVKAANKKIVGKLVTQCLNDLNPGEILLLSDGGPENDNRYIANLFNRYQELSGKRIQHFIAMRDLMKSNSMIERVFKTLKYEFNITRNPLSFRHLENLLDEVINTYNYEMPQGTYDYRTPDEVQSGMPPIDLSWKRQDVQKARKERNRKQSCSLCNC